jgi:hypothetical protein
MDSDLGLLKDYGHIIISICLILYGILYTYLANEYGHIDE